MSEKGRWSNGIAPGIQIKQDNFQGIIIFLTEVDFKSPRREQPCFKKPFLFHSEVIAD